MFKKIIIGEYVTMLKRKKELEEIFDADMNPYYEDSKKDRFKKQGKVSLINEFYRLYRQYIKKE